MTQPDPTTAPTDWVDGHPQLEAIAAAVWKRCGRSDSGACVEDDPRNIAVAALAAVLPAPDQRAAVLLEAADALPEADLPFVPPLDRRRVADWLRRLAGEAQQDPCAECGHPADAHREGDDPVTPGVCADCPDDDAHHDYEPAREERQDLAPGGATMLPCNWARTQYLHAPHLWEPQPGMEAVHCPGSDQRSGEPETGGEARCVCGDPIQLQDEADPTSWIHSPGSDTSCLSARPSR
ncbi:hypothetical protein ACFY8K_16910 [Streptomyces misionensis]|uniref:hypothetical protein n=1 Tax=Streptomyces misionensis TaxID=67331 RepID=UPI0036C1E3DF